MTKAKYYVENWALGGWVRFGPPYTSRRAAVSETLRDIRRRSEAAGIFCLSNTFRIRHKGRTIDRWQDGRRVTK